MFDVLFDYFEKRFALTPGDRSLIKTIFREKKLKKDDFLLRAGEINSQGAFVTKGFLRSYMIDNKGKEHILQFAPETWWISVKTGMATKGPSELFIDAIEDSHVLLLDEEGQNTLIQKLDGYAAAFQKGIQKRNDAKDKRIVHAMASTAEERYSDFLKTYPSIVQRVPQHMLASYLGITPETLSRVRRSLVKK